MSDKQNELRKAAEPLMKYLAENHHPHCKVLVDSGSAELLEGQRIVHTSREQIRLRQNHGG